MSFEIGKGQYAGKGGKNYPVTILDENKNVVAEFEIYGSHGTAKEKAKQYIKDNKESN